MRTTLDLDGNRPRQAHDRSGIGERAALPRHARESARRLTRRRQPVQ